MRWENLTVESEQGARLPGFKEPAVVRTFDAPEALGIRFYEVNARSAINAVPKRSRMPFRHTINPYRGCSHACVYCLSGEVPVLMGDGTTRPIAELGLGDAVYGTVRVGTYRRYTITEVKDHWETRKEAFRVTLDDGTEIVASGDHRFLSGRGWKFVTGSEQGRDRRPHLTRRTHLLGFGALSQSANESEAYRRGYLSGMIRGDGHIGSYAYVRPERRSIDRHHRFRLALVDLDALERTRNYLRGFGVSTAEFQFANEANGGAHRPLRAIRTSSAPLVERIKELIQWPSHPSLAWHNGFLAGIFDAEGSHADGVLRITNTDRELVARTADSLRSLGFSPVVERRHERSIYAVRFPGGLRERLRFLHGTNPAILRKRSIEGLALKCAGSRRVKSVEPVGERQLYDITTGTGDFIANGIVSHNCFARPTHTYLDFNAAEDFEREIVVKVNVPERLRAELARPSWTGGHIALGTNTDPYQWVEGRYRLMEGIWEAMRDFANPCSVLTKSPLLLRDLELMREISERTEFVASVSVPTLDEKPWRESEPHTPHPRKRLEALAELSRAGIRTGLLVAPLIPGVNDAPEQVERILELAGEAGVGSVTGLGLHLRGELRELWFDWLRQYRPDLLPRYERLYRRGAYLPKEESRRLADLVGKAKSRRGIPSRGPRRSTPAIRPAGGDERGGPPGSGDTAPGLQPSLF